MKATATTPGEGKTGAAAKERLLSKDYIIIMLSSMCINIYNYSFIATLPLYLLLLTGRTLYSGIIISVYSIAALIVRPLSGALSDRYGRVKLLIVGAIICSLAAAGFGFTTSLVLIIALRMIGGTGFGCHSTCGGAAAADIVPKSRLAEGIGYFGLYTTVGQMAGPAIALAIVAGGTAGDYEKLFFVCACIAAGAGVFAIFITYEKKRGKPEKEENAPKSGEVEAAKTKERLPDTPLPKTFLGFEYAVFAPGAVLLLMFFGVTSMLSCVTVFADWRGFGNSGLYFTFTAVGVLTSRLLFGKVVDKRGADPVVIPAAILMALCIASVPFVRSMTQLAALAFPIGLCHGAILPTMNQMMFRRCSPARRGTASGAYYFAGDLGIAVSSPLLGALADATDIRFAFWFGAAGLIAGLGLYLLICTDKRYNAKKAGETAG